MEPSESEKHYDAYGFPVSADLVHLFQKAGFLGNGHIKVSSRHALWKHHVPLRKPNLYASLKNSENELDDAVIVQIEKDLPRTFHDHCVFKSSDDSKISELSTASLERLLKRYAAFNRQVGYCQSMNFLGAFVLLTGGLESQIKTLLTKVDSSVPNEIKENTEQPHSQTHVTDSDSHGNTHSSSDGKSLRGDEPLAVEEFGFWLLDFLVRNVLVDYFSNSLVGVHTDQRVLEIVLQETCPDVLQAIHSHNVMLSLLCTHWLMCLFTTDMPAETTELVWEKVVQEKSSTPILRVIAALFMRNRTKILQCQDAQELIELIRAAPQSVFDGKALLNEAEDLPIESSVIDLLRGKSRAAIVDELHSTQRRREVHALTGITKFSRAELSKLQKEFEGLETARDGISRETFQKVLAEAVSDWSSEPGIVNRLYDVLDLDHNGVIDYVELMKGLSILSRGTLEEKLRVIFDIFDDDHSGDIDRNELFSLLKQAFVGKDEDMTDDALGLYVDSLMQTLDENGDGLLQFEEFVHVVKCEPRLVSMFFSLDDANDSKTQRRGRVPEGAELKRMGTVHLMKPSPPKPKENDDCDIL